MRIVRLDETGPAENLRLVEEPVPRAGPYEVVIRTALAGMIFGDMEARRGTYFKPTVLPFYPGREVAGEIVEVGEGVADHAVGDRVMALVVAGRCWADYVVAALRPTTSGDGRSLPAADVVGIPDEVSFEAALPYLVNFRLAHMLFHGSSRVPAGAAVLVHGGSGGMGSMVIQLARANDCLTIATCRTEEEAAYCRALGADHAIVTPGQDYVAEVTRITGGRGVGYSFNGVGGETLNRDFDVLQPFGELQAYGYVAGKSSFDAFRLGKTIALKTFSADNYLPTEMFTAATAAMDAWLRTATLRGVDVILPLADVVEANRRLDAGQVLGKIALRP